jgi:hypothetical protein
VFPGEPPQLGDGFFGFGDGFGFGECGDIFELFPIVEVEWLVDIGGDCAFVAL